MHAHKETSEAQAKELYKRIKNRKRRQVKDQAKQNPHAHGHKNVADATLFAHIVPSRK